MRHILDLVDLSAPDLRHLFREAARHKANHRHGERPLTLLGKVLALIFDKPSLRTRVSFQAAIAQLGGDSIFLSGKEAGLDSRESAADVARVVSQYADAIVIRTFRHEAVLAFAEHAVCPVINGLSDRYHPCQALADLFTMHELFGHLTGRCLVFVGDGNNVARSLAIVCQKLGVRFILAAPEGYGFDPAFIALCQEHLSSMPAFENDPARAVKAADVLYTDVWASMGQEAEAAERRHRFAPFQVNASLLGQAPAHARVMHCLPAHRGEEITSEVMDGGQSAVFQQAGNRMHLQKALLEWLLLPRTMA
jgi:ornithine carbamoyltransferase